MMDDNSICRTCLSESDNLISIFKMIDVQNESLQLAKMISKLNIQCVASDIFPKSVCQNCVYEICKCYFFQQQCVESLKTLKEMFGMDIDEENETNIAETTLFGLKDDDSNLDIDEPAFIIPNEKIPSPPVQVKTENLDFFNEPVEPQDLIQYVIMEYPENTPKHLENRYIVPDSNSFQSDIDSFKGSAMVVSNMNKKSKEYQNEELNAEFDYGEDDLEIDDRLNMGGTDSENEFVNEEHANKIMKEQTLKVEYNDSDDEFERYVKVLENELANTSAQTSLPSNITAINYNDSTFEDNVDEYTKKKLPFNCIICKKRFTKSEQLKRHLEMHNDDPQYECDVCGIEYKSARTYLNHMQIHNDISDLTTCQFCGIKTDTEEELKSHLTSNHNETKRFTCFFCELSFQKCTDRRNHMLSAHEDLYIRHQDQLEKLSVSQSNQDKQRAQLCDVCGKECRSGQAMHLHMLTHTQEKPFKCDICGKSFALKNYLFDHCQRHNPEKNFKCEICGKAFGRKRAMKEHIKRHTGERPYECHLCKTRLASRTSLQMHIRTHFGEKPYREQESRRAPRIRRKKPQSLSTLSESEDKAMITQEEESFKSIITEDVENIEFII